MQPARAAKVMNKYVKECLHSDDMFSSEFECEGKVTDHDSNEDEDLTTTSVLRRTTTKLLLQHPPSVSAAALDRAAKEALSQKLHRMQDHYLRNPRRGRSRANA